MFANFTDERVQNNSKTVISEKNNICCTISFMTSYMCAEFVTLVSLC